MNCVNCGEPLNSSYKVCPVCGAKQPDQQHVPSYTEQVSSEMGEAMGGMAGGFLVVIIAAVFLPILIFNPITIYLGQFKRKFFPSLSKISEFFLLISSLLYTLSFTGILFIGSQGTSNVDLLIIKLIDSLSTISTRLVLLSILVLLVSRLKEKRDGFSKFSFSIVSFFFLLTVPVSMVIPKWWFDFPVNGETRQMKQEEIIEKENQAEQQKINEVKTTPMDRDTVSQQLINSGYIQNDSSGIAGTFQLLSDNHFLITSKQNSDNTADLFLLPSDPSSSEYKKMINDYQISDTDSKPGSWFISHKTKNSGPQKANLITSLDQLPSNF